jgi:signal transduction histidine kinase/ligand-binding sensor domain-containing protein
VLVLAQAGAGGSIHAQPLPSPTMIDLPVTNGLIRWWPNLFDTRDEISGQEGVVLGVLPPVETGAEDETEFGRHTGWVQLQPAIPNEVFTLAFWVRIPQVDWTTRLLGQQAPDAEWLFQSYLGPEYFISPHRYTESDRVEHVVLTLDAWHHVALARKPDGTSRIWVDGVLALEGRRSHPWPSRARWLTVGSAVQGEEYVFQGAVRDLCAFDRVLDDGEVRALHATGVPQRPAWNTRARLAATARSIGIEVSTNMVTAPARSWLHRRFTTEDGLPGNAVKAILQTRNGYLWAGTEEGLARFDGRQFRTFTADNTAALKTLGQMVWSLSEDSDGTIWVGVFGGLLRIRDLEFTAFTNGLPQHFVLQAEPVGDGSVWVAGFNDFVPRGPLWLRRYHPDSGTSSAAVVVPGHLRRLVVATNGVWMATEQPQLMLFWDGQAPAPAVVGTVDRAPLTVQVSDQWLDPSARVRAWKRGTETAAEWWAEVNVGLDDPIFHWHWEAEFWRPWTARWNGPIEPQEVWLGVFHSLARLRGDLLETPEFADQLTGREIECVTPNREGGVWFGTDHDGLHLMQERLVRVFTTGDGLNGSDIRSVCAQPSGGVWVTTAGGLSHYRDGEWTAHGVERLRPVAVDRHGRPWFGRQGHGIHQLRRDADDLDRYGVDLGLDWQDPNSLRFAVDGTLWIACEYGLTWLKPERLAWTAQENWVPDSASAEPAYGRYAVGRELPQMFPLGLVEDRDGSIWLGSLAHGLVRVNQGRVQVYSENDGLPGNHCVPVFGDDSGAVWITGRPGLTRYANGRFQTIRERDGLPKDLMLDLIEDDLGNFWLSGKRGIHRIARRELEEFFAGRLKRVQSLSLGARDGLLTPECTSLNYPTMAKTLDGHIWVATRNGLATFDPGRVRLDTQPLTATIEQVVVNRREVPLTPALSPTGGTGGEGARRAGEGDLRLPPGSGERVEFHFTAISLVAADRVRFRHRLDGYDTDWSPETDLRLAFYTNLRPGDYQFRVTAANAHGVWNEEETTLSFAILPYFWQTGTFYLGVACATLALGSGAHWRRLTVQRRHQELKHQEALTMEKARIAADMHDELGSTLTRIVILGEVAKTQSGDTPLSNSTLDSISQAARDVTSRMRDLVWATNPRNDTLANLVAYLRGQAAALLENTAIHPLLDFPSSCPEASVSATFRRNVLLVMKESLHNVLKHARASEVSVQLEIAGLSLGLRIRDNGCGFDASNRDRRGNGLGNMEKRIRDLGGEFSLRSVPGQGTMIEIKVPLK